MNIYIKIFLIVLIGTVIGWFAINYAIHSTDHMPDRFSISTTGHLDGRGDDASGQSGMVILSREEPKSGLQSSSAHEAIDESLDAVNRENSQGGGGSSQASVVIPKVSAALIAGDKPAELPEIDDALEDDEKEDEETEDEEDERADSDSDMQKRGGDGTSNESKKTKNKTNITTAVKKTSVQALDIAYALPAETTCTIPGNEFLRVGVHYREGSRAIRGKSLSGIDQLINLHRKCNGGKLLVLQNWAGLKDSEQQLIQLRQDEIKYYLLQRQIPKDDMIFPDNS